ncbi:transcriptional regulator, MarR family [Denitrovibrio acetiphilus DSM 12809]|uniref:Transcriptional regulator, MarR family n=1 Tax=Denitrovibrio acetiphilus (strain DSM 12809 / NBRC 114555 / N2460) TaxID=522772 RepID=D4H7F2_DENA2|nr:MarR family transcriptional regulator [Denitrovibrio acetiphilus]ADD67951.1 transcriptional regulator, MarR family [Denitrovibrio acetiphilus DSM 12809]
MSSNICIQTILEIRKLSRFLDKYSKYLNNNYNVTLPQMLSLYEISQHDSMNLTELTRSVNLNNSAITGIVDRLEAKGFVNRVKKAGDRRTIYLEITPAGKEYTALLTKILEDDCFFDEKKLGKENVNDIFQSLAKITNALDPEIKKIEIL